MVVNSVDTLFLEEMTSEDELDMELFDTNGDDGDLIDQVEDSNPIPLFDTNDKILDDDDDDDDYEES